jgi:hypothetical protein
MSRSNPHENGIPNPSTRWFEWNGENGTVRYYDKEKKENVEVGSDFTFILLDRLGTVGGWHDASSSSIYANEVKDTRQDVLVVKSFKGGTLAEGLYKDIKDRVNSEGGQFVASCYIAYKDDGGELAIAGMRFKGAALGAWMDFEKAHRADLYKKAIRIQGSTEGKKGRVVFRTPNLKLVDVTPETDLIAIALDKQVQDYLAVYLKRNKREQVEAASKHVRDEDVAYDDNSQDGRVELPPARNYGPPLTDDDIPFAWLMPLVLPAMGALSYLVA